MKQLTENDLDSFSYAISFQSVFYFFVLRASYNELLQKTPLYKLLSFLCKFGLIVFVPIYTIVGAILFNSYRITPDGVCILVNNASWYMAIFIVGMVTLTLSVMYLFAAPLLSSLVAPLGYNEQSLKRLKMMLYRNIFLNTFAMVGTIILISLFTYYDNPDALPEQMVRSVTLPASDICLLGFCSRLMIVDEPRWDMLAAGWTRLISCKRTPPIKAHRGSINSVHASPSDNLRSTRMQDTVSAVVVQ